VFIFGARNFFPTLWNDKLAPQIRATFRESIYGAGSCHWLDVIGVVTSVSL